MAQPETETSPELWNQAADLKAAADCLLYLAAAASDRLTLTQGAFFMLAATSDAAGRPVTRTMLLDAHPTMRGSIRNSYRQLLETSRAFPNALGWLCAEPNPNDDREQFLRLTKKGKKVAERVLLALEPRLSGAT